MKGARFKFVLIITFLAACTALAFAEEEEKPLPIILGMSTALSGPAQSLGIEIKTGIESYFARINEEGGVYGRRIKFITLDDGYVPEAAIRNMHILIDEKKVLAVLGNMGTPTAAVTVPIATEKKTLLFAPGTGAELVRQTPPNRYVINYRASYTQETAVMVRGILEAGILPHEIAIFTQNDTFGDDGYMGIIKGLKAAGYDQGHLLPHGRYERNTVNIEQGLLTILEAPVKPKVIIMVGTYAACAKFIRIMKRVLSDVIYMNVSFVASTALKNALGPDGEGIVITQVVPHFESNLPLTREYLKDLKSYDPEAEPDFLSLEGYIVARIFIEGLKRAGPDVDKETIIDAILSIKNLDIGMGTPISYTNDNYQGSQKVWQTVIRNGHFEAFDFASLNKGDN
jgi:ABC-type branched-subunit amino acid transport system substrate-binding protein